MNIAILSAAHGHVGSYVPLLQALAGVAVIGLADDDAARGQAAARQFGIPFFSHYEELLAQQPQAVLVCSENTRHRWLVELAAAAGAHVLCEKPLATSVADARAMVDACERAGVLLMTAFPMRFSAPLAAVRNELAAGVWGRVYCFNATNQGQLPEQPWFVDPHLSGGGALTDHVVHLADVFRWYLSSEIVEVYAQSNRIMHAQTVAVETGGQVMLRFANGVFASIDCSWSKPPYYPTWGGLGFEMVAEAGVVWVEAFQQNLTVYSQQRQRSALLFWGSDADAAMLEEFVAAVREGRAPAVSGTDGLRAVEAVAAAYRSVQAGQPVRLEQSAAAYTVRPARDDDVPLLPAIDLAAAELFRDTPFAFVAADATSVESLRAYHAQHLLWVVADSEDRPVGFAMARVVDDAVYLAELSIDPAYGRRGLGTLLIETVSEWARQAGYPAVTLSTFRDIAWNAPFYERRGFRILAEAELGPGLLAVRAREAQAGLPVAERVFMRREP